MDNSESPLPKHPDLFGSFPSAAAGEKYFGLCYFLNSVLTMMTGDASRLKVLRLLEAKLSTNQIKSVLRQRFSINEINVWWYSYNKRRYFMIYNYNK